MKKAERGTVIVLTLAGLAAILGVIGLAIDLGLMFDYKQRTQTAADAAALAAALSPGDYDAAAKEMTKANGFEHGVGNIKVYPDTPPNTGEHTGLANYFEVTVTDEYPTYFLKMIGIGKIPIAVRAVAGIDGTGGNCMVAGIATTENNLKLEASQCNLYFSSLDDQGNIVADEINIAQTNPSPPGTFPPFPSNCISIGKCNKSTLNPGCYDKIIVEGKDCVFKYGAYYIKEILKFETDAEATNTTSSTDEGVTFFLAPNSSFDFNGKATLTSGAAPDFKDVLFWSKGKEIQFGPNSKADLTGIFYAPDVTTKLAGKINLYEPSGWSSGASSKVLIVE